MRKPVLFAAASLNPWGIENKYDQDYCIPCGLIMQFCNCISCPKILPLFGRPGCWGPPNYLAGSLEGGRKFFTLSFSDFDCQIIMLKCSPSVRIFFYDDTDNHYEKLYLKSLKQHIRFRDNLMLRSCLTKCKVAMKAL